MKAVPSYLLGATSALAVVGLVLLWPNRVYASQQAHLTQVIASQQCVLTTTVAEDGSLNYSTPPGCGVPVVPTPTAHNNPASQPQIYTAPIAASPVATPPADAGGGVFFGGQVRYLESASGVEPSDGYLLVSRLGMRYTFYVLGDTRGTSPRMMQLIAVNAQSVTLRFMPGNTEVTIAVGETVQLQLAQNNITDVHLHLQHVAPDGTVMLQVYFPNSTSLLGSVDEDMQAFIASIVLLAAATLGVYIYVHEWYLARRRLPSNDWWLLHSHEPFGDGAKVGLAWHTPHRPKHL